MAKKSGGGLLLLLVIVAGVLGYGYFRSQQGSSAEPPAPPGSEAGGGVGRYVALGDSYTSAPRTGAQAGTPAGCQRSDNNYPHLVAAALNPAEFADVSCGGATTAHLSSAQQTKDGTNPPQLDAVNEATTLVTVGIGGNDVGFVALAGQCATGDPAAGPCKARLTAGGKDELAAKVNATAAKISSVLTKIHDKAPNARVVVVGYPTILPDGNGCWPSLPIGAPDVAYLRGSLTKMNAMLAEQAKKHQAGFADTAAMTKGHDLCAASGTRWVEGLIPSAAAIALHPNAAGARAMADAVRKVL
ncbi:SGNH/GDSL hydrolase family protein [Amycolatopsis nigrescens]|uniref:SGNH/GDSL hydrolase family protein n=1 Tax=Amycolatopsis nigrescens TaxID=381445 RepID=UPI00036D88BC|nr:SGNH/GDSL hydrolase family protein [Amycolatopsis nigrescens]